MIVRKMKKKIIVIRSIIRRIIYGLLIICKSSRKTQLKKQVEWQPEQYSFQLELMPWHWNTGKPKWITFTSIFTKYCACYSTFPGMFNCLDLNGSGSASWASEDGTSLSTGQQIQVEMQSLPAVRLLNAICEAVTLGYLLSKGLEESFRK